MGEQKRSDDYSGWTKRMRPPRRRMSRYARVQSEGPQLHIVISDVAGGHLNRHRMKGYNDSIHTKAEVEDPMQNLIQANAGSAFSWWSSMNAEERERVIAGAIAESAPATAKGRSYAARRKK